ncbi:MAG: SCO family protein [Acidobacteriota bacterium]
MKTRTVIAGLAISLPLALPAPALAAGQSESAHHAAMTHESTGDNGAEHAEHRRMLAAAAHAEMAHIDSMQVDVEVHDLELHDQDDRRVRLASDVIGNKLAAVTFVYSSCTTICPIYSALFTQIQDLLGDRLEREVVLITLTLDPTTDIPLRLKREARKYRAKPGWYYLTGAKTNVDQVLRGFDAYFPDFTQHPPMALVGDGATGTWKRYNGFPQPEQVVTMLDELRAARQAQGG